MRETEWIRRFIAPLVTAPGAFDLNDDVAALGVSEGHLIITADMLVEGRHFLSDDPVETVGQKLIRVSVSDIFAKGGSPDQAVMSIAWPMQQSEQRFADLMSGIRTALEDFDIQLIGGDLVGTEGPLVLNLTLTGKVHTAKFPNRSGAVPGDSVWVSGEIGFGGLGLHDARRGDDTEAASRYRIPKLATSQQVALVAKHATASLDVSDGLLLDASRMAQASNVEVRIQLDWVPVADPNTDMPGVIDQCCSGDDYQILLAAPGTIELPGFTKIGEIVEGNGLDLSWNGERVAVPERLGFSHDFAR